MDDRRMLELAAKAAEMEPCEIWGMPFVKGDSVAPRLTWNPLTDDGDAFRLAVKLGINIIFSGDRHYVGKDRHVMDICCLGGIDAVRYGVVQAAAAIGEQMP